jgi:hypothetical protein
MSVLHLLRRKNSFMTMIGVRQHIINVCNDFTEVGSLLILCPDLLQSSCFNACGGVSYNYNIDKEITVRGGVLLSCLKRITYMQLF